MPEPRITADDVNAGIAGQFEGPMRGGDCWDVGPDFAVCRRIPDEFSYRPGGLISGPVQFSMVDAVLWYLTFGVIDRVELMSVTTDVDITFLRPCQGEVLWARADLLSAGSRRIVGSARVWTDDNEDKPSAVAKGTYALPR